MRVRNLEEYELYGVGDKLMCPGEGARTVSFDVNPVGPVVVRLYTKVPGKKEPVAKLVGWAERQETFDVTVKGECWVQLEPSMEVWVRHKWKRVVNPNPGEGETFTVMEKMGLYVDDIGVALHRQAVLAKIANDRENYGRDAYQRQLETQLLELNKRIEALQPSKQEPPVDDNPA